MESNLSKCSRRRAHHARGHQSAASCRVGKTESLRWKKNCVRALRVRDRPALLSHPVLQAYDAYYRQFKKTYHVQLQLESILFKGKSIPSVAALVEAMFMAEMNDLLLTAGHDLDALHLPPDAGRGARNRNPIPCCAANTNTQSQ